MKGPKMLLSIFTLTTPPFSLRVKVRYCIENKPPLYSSPRVEDLAKGPPSAAIFVAGRGEGKKVVFYHSWVAHCHDGLLTNENQ